MVGGDGLKSSHYDIITQGTRQPGSGFKLFTLLAALQPGYSIYDTPGRPSHRAPSTSRPTMTW